MGFHRPLTNLVKRTLTISNLNEAPVAFKVKTTAPKLYCVRPNSGRIEPGESVDVSVMLQAMKEEPPLSAKCKDKFLIQSTIITQDKETLPLQDIWGTTEGGEEAKVHQQKLKVVYLPPVGQTLVEEDEGPANYSTLFDTTGDSQFDTVKSHPATNGHSVDPIPDFTALNGQESFHNVPTLQSEPEVEARSGSPTGDFTVAHEEAHEEPYHAPSTHRALEVADTSVQTQPPQLPPSPPVMIPIFESRELQAKYDDAQAEIARLRALLAAVPDNASSVSGLRRRTNGLSADDDGTSSTMGGTEVGTAFTEAPQEGVPLQVVVIVALAVFITTYLFF